VSDDETARLRELVAEQDRAILAAANARLELVAELKEHKRRIGAAFADPRQEERLLAALERLNAGPMSPDGVRRLFGEILALTKRELDDRAG
jgi:chorismate mutase